MSSVVSMYKYRHLFPPAERGGRLCGSVQRLFCRHFAVLSSQACNGNFEVLNASVENAGTVNNMSVQTGMTPMLYGTQDNVLNRSIMFYCK